MIMPYMAAQLQNENGANKSPKDGKEKKKRMRR